MADADDPHAARRGEIFSASLASANTRAWGYFGLTGSLAIGDNSYAPRLTKKAPPAEDGAEPLKNLCGGTLKKGASPDVYFRFESPLAIGDLYQDAGLLDRKGKVWMVDPDASFKPPGAIKRSANKLGYDYIPHCDQAKDPKEIREKYRDYMPPRQICSNPAKKGGSMTKGVLFGWGEDRNFVSHMPDDYDYPKKLRAKELEEHRSKTQEMSFKGMHYGNTPFGSNTDTYHYDIPTHIPRETEKQSDWRKVHESAFRPPAPSKKGMKGLMGGIPEYIADPVAGGAVRKPPRPDDAPPAFRNGLPQRAFNPMPSVVTNLRNMRNERPHSFSRPVL